jgi:hypothetical protein
MYYGLLVIYYTRQEDSGIYECEAPNGLKDQVRLNVLSDRNYNKDYDDCKLKLK